MSNVNLDAFLGGLAVAAAYAWATPAPAQTITQTVMPGVSLLSPTKERVRTVAMTLDEWRIFFDPKPLCRYPCEFSAGTVREIAVKNIYR